MKQGSCISIFTFVLLILSGLFCRGTFAESIDRAKPKMQISLSGRCSKLFPAKVLNFSSFVTFPAAPLDVIESSYCRVKLTLKDSRTKRALPNIPIRIDKVISTSELALNSEAIATVRTSKSGKVELTIQWDPSACSYTFSPYDDSDPSGPNIMWPPELLTAKGLFGKGECKNTFGGRDTNYWGE